MNKKAFQLHQNLIAGLVIGAIVITLLAVFAMRYKQSMEESNQRVTCSQSVRNYAINPPLVGRMSDSITCPTTYVTLKQDPSNKKEDEEIKKHFAETLLEAFRTFGNGELRLFEEAGVFCVIYEVAEFQEKDAKIYEFGNFLNKKPKGLLFPKGDGSYVAQLVPVVNGATIPAEAFGNVYKSFVIDTNKKYATYFVYGSQKSVFETVFRETYGGGFMDAVSTATGSEILFNGDEFVSFVILDEYNADVLRRLGCTELPIKQNQKPTP